LAVSSLPLYDFPRLSPFQLLAFQISLPIAAETS
jgi:hypothetical protein